MLGFLHCSFLLLGFFADVLCKSTDVEIWRSGCLPGGAEAGLDGGRFAGAWLCYAHGKPPRHAFLSTGHLRKRIIYFCVIYCRAIICIHSNLQWTANIEKDHKYWCCSCLASLWDNTKWDSRSLCVENLQGYRCSIHGWKNQQDDEI